MRLSDFIPPILYKIGGRFLRISARAFAPPVYQSFEAASLGCHNLGYEDGQLIEVVYQKTVRLKEQIYSSGAQVEDSTLRSLLAVLVAASAKDNDRLTVIDFGGACGAHYFYLRSLLPMSFRLNWAVVETAAMTQRAKALETDELRFFASISKAMELLGSIDLLHSSGAIQYMPDPEKTIEEMLACVPKFLFLNRLTLSGDAKIITVQYSRLSSNGPGPMPAGMQDRDCCYPVTYTSKIRLEEILERGYRMRMRFADQPDSFLNTPLFIKGGYLVEKMR